MVPISRPDELDMRLMMYKAMFIVYTNSLKFNIPITIELLYYSP